MNNNEKFKINRTFSLDNKIYNTFAKLVGYGEISQSVEDLMNKFIRESAVKTIEKKEIERAEQKDKETEDAPEVAEYVFHKEALYKIILEKGLIGDARQEFIIDYIKEQGISNVSKTHLNKLNALAFFNGDGIEFNEELDREIGQRDLNNQEVTYESENSEGGFKYDTL